MAELSEGSASARDHVLRHFRWIGGDADTWSMLRDAESLRAVVGELAEALRKDAIDVVAGVEARGFVLGAAVAASLGVGFAPIRKDAPLFPGDTIAEITAPDYRGTTHELRARRDLLSTGTRVALVDDWIETGSTALAAARLVERCGAELVTIAVVIDDASDDARADLPTIRSIISAALLPASEPHGDPHRAADG